MNQGIFARTNFTFVMTALRSLMLVAAGIYLARAMGPNTFGELSFLLASFIGLKALLDLGTSSAFYTFVSGKNVKEMKIIPEKKKRENKKFLVIFIRLDQVF